MKAKSVFIGLFVVLALVFGLVLAGCSPDPGGGNPFVGTWTGYDLEYNVVRAVVDQSTWTWSYPAYPQWGVLRGTYTYSGNTGTFFDEIGNVLGTATVSGNTMTMTQFGLTITLSK